MVSLIFEWVKKKQKKHVMLPWSSLFVLTFLLCTGDTTSVKLFNNGVSETISLCIFSSCRAACRPGFTDSCERTVFVDKPDLIEKGRSRQKRITDTQRTLLHVSIKGRVYNAIPLKRDAPKLNELLCK